MAGFKSLLTAFVVAISAISCSKDGLIVDKVDSEYGMGGIIGAVTGGSQGGDSTLEAGKVTAGEWNDLENWGFWEELVAKPSFEKYPAYWGFNNGSRISVRLKNEQGFAIVDEPVQLIDANGTVLSETRTDNRGLTELFPFLHGLNSQPLAMLSIKASNQTFSALKKYSDGLNELVISKQELTPEIADIAFVVDATSSMADEISYLKTELEDVIKKVQSKYTSLTVNDINDQLAASTFFQVGFFYGLERLAQAICQLCGFFGCNVDHQAPAAIATLGTIDLGFNNRIKCKYQRIKVLFLVTQKIPEFFIFR